MAGLAGVAATPGAAGPAANAADAESIVAAATMAAHPTETAPKEPKRISSTVSRPAATRPCSEAAHTTWTRGISTAAWARGPDFVATWRASIQRGPWTSGRIINRAG